MENLKLLSKEALNDIQSKIGYVFKKNDYLIQAFIRQSYVEEHHNYFNLASNEVLEFYGDKILDFIIIKLFSERYFYDIEVDFINDDCTKKDPYKQTSLASIYNESLLTEKKIYLVKSTTLSSAISSLDISKYLIMSKGDIKNHFENNQSVKEDLFESILGAVAIDCNWNTDILTQVVKNMLNPEDILNSGASDIDHKKELITAVNNNKYRGSMNISSEQYSPNNDGVSFYYADIVFNGYFEKNYSDIFQNEFRGEGYTEQEAVCDAYRLAYTAVSNSNKTTSFIEERFNEISPETAINILQELYHKGYICEPKYEISDSGTKENGNIVWNCSLSISINGEHLHETIGSDSKKKSKKWAAFLILQKIVNHAMINTKEDSNDEND
ncbi:MAG: ribonuclease III family protein [Clostridia bacterium]|nr:ribonuclease III family protein [Clostridia bacterium]